MKLYYMPGSCAMADHIALEWIGQPYTAQKMSREDLKSPDYLKLNPSGKVPVLEHEGWVLSQNTAILGFLADSFPDAQLSGDGSPKQRAEVTRWLGFLNADVHPTFHPFFGSADSLGEEAAKKAKQQAGTKLHDQFGQLDQQLQGKEWLTGSRSIADPYLFVVLRWAKANKVDLSGYDNLARFFDRMSADSGVAKVLAEEGVAGK